MSYNYSENIHLKKKRCNYSNSLINTEKAIIADGLSCVAPLFDERCSCNAMIE